jgi:hypothetical protein
MTKLYETINKTNWVKYHFSARKRQAACLSGHVNRLYPRNCRSDVISNLERVIKVVFPERVCSSAGGVIAYFNDYPDTTVADVIRVCKIADV